MKVSLFHVWLGMGMTRLVDAFVVRSSWTTLSTTTCPTISSTTGRTRPTTTITTTTTTTRIRHPSVVFATEVDVASESLLVLLTSDQVEARTAFYIWFFGASGAAGVARSAFPRMYQNLQEIQSYRTIPTTTTTSTTSTTTIDGSRINGSSRISEEQEDEDKMVGISVWCGYPRDLAVQDVQAILQNELSIDQMVQKYPVKENLWSQKGYITYQAFRQANSKVDPLAVRAVFDCFSQSTEVSNPNIAQAKLNRYKESLEHLKQDLLYSKVVGWAAIATLLGLLGLADFEAFQYAYAGWFPDWPGGRLWLQGGLFDPDIGVWSIPNYWI